MRKEIKFLLTVIVTVSIGFIAAMMGYKTFSYGFLALVSNVAFLITGFLLIRRNDNIVPLSKAFWLLLILFTSFIGFLAYYYYCERNNLEKV